jgi:hypothetical protein
VLVRDYKECLIRQIFQQENIKITRDKVGEIMNRNHSTMYDVDLYFEHIRTYDRFIGPKAMIHYEDLMEFGQIAFKPVEELLKLNTENLDWVEESATSMLNYGPGGQSGGETKYHQFRIWDIYDYQKRIRSIDPRLADKYLERYKL